MGYIDSMADDNHDNKFRTYKQFALTELFLLKSNEKNYRTVENIINDIFGYDEKVNIKGKIKDLLDRWASNNFEAIKTLHKDSTEKPRKYHKILPSLINCTENLFGSYSQYKAVEQQYVKNPLITSRRLAEVHATIDNPIVSQLEAAKSIDEFDNIFNNASGIPNSVKIKASRAKEYINKTPFKDWDVHLDACLAVIKDYIDRNHLKSDFLKEKYSALCKSNDIQSIANILLQNPTKSDPICTKLEKIVFSETMQEYEKAISKKRSSESYGKTDSSAAHQRIMARKLSNKASDYFLKDFVKDCYEATSKQHDHKYHVIIKDYLKNHNNHPYIKKHFSKLDKQNMYNYFNELRKFLILNPNEDDKVMQKLNNMVFARNEVGLIEAVKKNAGRFWGSASANQLERLVKSQYNTQIYKLKNNDFRKLLTVFIDEIADKYHYHPSIANSSNVDELNDAIAKVNTDFKGEYHYYQKSLENLPEYKKLQPGKMSDTNKENNINHSGKCVLKNPKPVNKSIDPLSFINKFMDEITKQIIKPYKEQNDVCFKYPTIDQIKSDAKPYNSVEKIFSTLVKERGLNLKDTVEMINEYLSDKRSALSLFFDRHKIKPLFKSNTTDNLSSQQNHILDFYRKSLKTESEKTKVLADNS